MVTVEFQWDTDEAKEGAEFKAGAIVVMSDASASRWIRRGAAIEVESQEAPKRKRRKKPAEPIQSDEVTDGESSEPTAE